MSTRYYEATYRWLCIQFPDFHDMTMDAISTCIAGKPQGGKSDFTFGIALLSRLRGFVPIMILRNFSKDAVQMQRKFERFISRHEQYMNSQGWNESRMKVYVTNDVSIKEFDDLNLILVLYNGYQLNIANTMTSTKKYVLLVDEADVIAYGEILKGKNRPKHHAAGEYNTLMKGASQTWEISATVWDILYGNHGLTTDNVVVVRPSKSYKGIRDDVECIPLVHKIEKWSRGSDILKSDTNMLEVYNSLSNQSCFRADKYHCIVDHPIIILHKSYVWQHHHDVFLRTFYPGGGMGDNWTVMVEDSRAIQLYSNILRGSTITLGGETVTDNKQTGLFVFIFRITDIQVVLQWLKDNGGCIKFPNIVIKTGQQAGRSRSYVSADGGWHLTHEYLVPSRYNRNVADLIQAVRLCHDRPDSIPLILYAPNIICIELKKADILQDEQLQRLREIKTNLIVSDHIQVDVWSTEKVPKYCLCKSKRNKKFKLLPIFGIDGGWDNSLYSTDKNILGGYSVLDRDKFTKETVVYQMLGDVKKILISKRKTNQNIDLQWINKELQKLQKWNEMSFNNIHGALWTSVRNNKKLLKVSSIQKNTMVMWKVKSKGYIYLDDHSINQKS
jgi:hypothetical protein